MMAAAPCTPRSRLRPPIAPRYIIPPYYCHRDVLGCALTLRNVFVTLLLRAAMCKDSSRNTARVQRKSLRIYRMNHNSYFLGAVCAWSSARRHRSTSSTFRSRSSCPLPTPAQSLAKSVLASNILKPFICVLSRFFVFYFICWPSICARSLRFSCTRCRLSSHTQAGAIIRGIMQQSGTNIILEPLPPRPATERMVQIRVSICLFIALLSSHANSQYFILRCSM